MTTPTIESAPNKDAVVFVNVSYCPIGKTFTVETQFSQNRPLQRGTRKIPCQLGFAEPHKDLRGPVAIPLSAVLDMKVKSIAEEKAYEVFNLSPPT